MRRSRRARHARVQVCAREGVVVVLPWRAGTKILPELLADWGEWMDAQAEKLGVRLGPQVREYGTGSTLAIRGEPCLIEVREAGRRRTSRVERVGDTLVMHLVPRDVFATRPVLEKYLRQVARTDLVARTAYWADRLGLHPQKVIVGERTTRWGSCSRRGTLSFCWRLILAPPHVIDAVVAHELCHLRHLNHGKGFYALLDKACPWHREADAWLRTHHDELNF
ncbi:M48 family metallopeptidase [bacterium]|nr:M48 family metallopeptidase [bacterium]